MDPHIPQHYISVSKLKRISYSSRCVTAITKGWTSAGDCVQFWLHDHQDDMAAKLQLMQKMSCLCFKCSPPKAGLFVVCKYNLKNTA